MYNTGFHRAPVDEPDFWSLADEIFEFIQMDFDIPIETREGAIKTPQSDWYLVKFRKTDEGLEWAIDLGLELIPRVEHHLDARVLSPEFAHDWAILMFAHGYVMNSVLAMNNDLELDRMRKKGAENAKRTDAHSFLARAVLWHIDRRQMSKKEAETSTAKLIHKLLNDRIVSGKKKEWFASLIRDRLNILSTVSKMSTKKLEKLAAEASVHAPSIKILGLK